MKSANTETKLGMPELTTGSERWREIDTEKVKRSDADIWKDSIAIAEKGKREKTERSSRTSQYCNT